MSSIPFVIMTIVLLAVLFVSHIVLSGEESGPDETDEEQTTHPLK